MHLRGSILRCQDLKRLPVEILNWDFGQRKETDGGLVSFLCMVEENARNVAGIIMYLIIYKKIIFVYNNRH